MLNISFNNSINKAVNLNDYKSFGMLRKSRIRRLPLYLSLALIIGILLSMFLPWTQNILAKGYVTTRLPDQRPQSIQSVISGRVDEWFVREGDFVNTGDTIVFLLEVKSDYFDPDLILRTEEQVDAKSQSIESYGDKIDALKNQYKALSEGMELKKKQISNKIEQAKNKISIDSIDLQAYFLNLEIVENQLARTKELFDKGLKSLSEMQEKELKLQEISAKVAVQKNKLINQKNELANLHLELFSIEQDYFDKLSKSRSDQQSAISERMENIAATAKLQNQLSNYSQRQQFYHITAPQSGYITKTIKKGIGEILKEGEDICTIMPAKYDPAVEVYVKPQDLPLISIGNRVRLRFDGWPALVISGWPESSTGLFSGEVVAIDQFISERGSYRTMIAPDEKDPKKWPEMLRVGTGSNAFILLNDVPLWYEIWRQLNGFPADFYLVKDNDSEVQKQKAPLKSVK